MKMDSVAVNTLNYSPDSRIFGVNAMAFWLFPTLSRFDVIDVGVVVGAAVDAVDAAAVAVATVIDSAVESLP